MATPSAFGQRLRELRERAHLTQAELARRAGISRPSLVRLETGSRGTRRAGLSLESAVRLANALGCTLDKLVGDLFDHINDDEAVMATATL